MFCDKFHENDLFVFHLIYHWFAERVGDDKFWSIIF